ncbi:hypothetical protein [Streptomyces sp. AC495_CC817]|uniref:hypothetical protein n=1 Tax=Streptomyces sp. AC495_CC817 TaxID=2823900 RepID=UPI001C26F175|nr:hypothetical protein [Streptomyces sp. AC495_CC817]
MAGDEHGDQPRDHVPGVDAETTEIATEGLRRMVAATARIFEAASLEYAQVQRASENIIRTFAEQVAPILERFEQHDVRSIAASLSVVVDQLAKYLPPNWRGAEIPDLRDVQHIAEEERIAFVHVPRASIVTLLLAAPDAPTRRALLEEHADSIALDCAEIAATMSTPRGREYGRFLALSVDALRAGHTAASQALSTNLVDTLGGTYITPETFGHRWKVLVGKNLRTKVLAQTLRTSLVLLPLSAAYTSYDPGAEIPEEFSRHATSHGVSARQYNRANAVLSLMSAASLLRWLEDDRAAFDEPELAPDEA